MKNFILEKTDQVRWYTNMREVFEATNIAPQDYDWYVSDIETNWRPPGFQPDDQWFTGDDLATLLHAYEIQFIWAVFSHRFVHDPMSRGQAIGNRALLRDASRCALSRILRAAIGHNGAFGISNRHRKPQTGRWIP